MSEIGLMSPPPLRLLSSEELEQLRRAERRITGRGHPSHTVLVTGVWRPVAIFHLTGEYDATAGDRLTLCGHGWDDGRDWRNALLRRDHAERIARPCKRCLHALAMREGTA